MEVGDWILLSLAILGAVPLAVLTVELLAALFPRRNAISSVGNRPNCAVLIPAHDEEIGIVATVANVLAQVRPGDRVLVIADNCTDSTAEVARTAGAEVVVRHDPDRRGKGFALDYGLRHLRADPPPVVVVVDADCELGHGALNALVLQAATTGRPAQGIYLIGTGEERDPRRRLSAFAVLVKNEIRPLGLHRLGLPCLLTGTGMAFPWAVIGKADLGTGNIVEDMKLGIDLALAGVAPSLCPSARLTSGAAPDLRTAIQQRTRWEHGHVNTLIAKTPRLLITGVLRFRPGLIGLGLELGVPPLSLLGAGNFLLLANCIVWWLALSGSWAPVAVIGGAFFIALAAGLLAWVKFGRRVLPFGVLIATPAYVLWKVPIYLKMAVSRQKTWVRTARTATRE